MTGRHTYALIVSMAVVGAMLWPLWRGSDGFPLSNYPMFSREKAPKARIFHIVGFSSSERHRPIPPPLLGTEEVMQASQTTKLAIVAGREASTALCKEVAGRVAEAGDAWADLTHLEVRSDLYDTIAYWNGRRTPLHTRVVARCAVTRGDPR